MEQPADEESDMADVFGKAVLEVTPRTEKVMRVVLDFDALERGEDIGCKIPHGAKAGDPIIFVRK